MTLTLADLEKFLGEPAAAKEIQPFLDAASVLAVFDPVSLRPLGNGKDVKPLDGLLPLCEPITEGSERGLWSLSLAERRAGLRRLGTRERMVAALAANPNRVHTAVQGMFERVVEGAPIGLDALGRDDLAAAITVQEWLKGLLDGVPDEASVRRALARHDLIAPLLRLTSGGFVNRDAEVAQLSAYVSAPPPPAPLFVHGLGGVGKSTLLAKCSIDQLERDDRAVVYIDIDRPTIRPEEPLTLLAEVIAQLNAQLELPPRVLGLNEQIAESLGRREESRQLESAPIGDPWILEQFRDLLAEIPRPMTPIVVVDTFEEAQFLGPDVVWTLTDFLFRLAREAKMVRVVVSGRALPEEYSHQAPPVPEDAAWRPIDLGVLDQSSARELLTTSIELAGLPELSTPELDDVIAVVSPNPMCLKLAVRLLRDEGVAKLRMMRSEVLTRLRAEKVQALLYGRILHHIHTKDVKKVAYPGLVVRRITADVIKDVLAGPCKIKLTSDRNEHHIFWDLQKEAALVEPQSDGSLRHRADVRRAMLEDLTDHVPPEVVAAIDAAAVAFYEQQEGAIARAEEIYHRLRRRDDAAVLEERWLPEVGTWLKNAGDDLPSQERLWLAEKLGSTLDPSVRETASQEAWEAQAERSADRYLQSAIPDRALEVLHERAERLPRSTLFSLEAEAYRFQGRADDALAVARAGVESTTRAGAIDMALELLLKMENIEEGRGNDAGAAVLTEEATAVASHSQNELLKLRTAVTELRVHRRRHPELREERATKRAEALAMLTPEVVHELRSRSVLLREVAAELAKDDADIASIAFESLGVELATDEQAELLGRALVGLLRDAPGAGHLGPELVHAVEAFEDSDFDPVIVREWSMKRTSGRDARDISKAVAASAPGDVALRQLGKYFRAGVENSIRS